MSPATTPTVQRHWNRLYWDEIDSPLPELEGSDQTLRLLLVASDHGLVEIGFVPAREHDAAIAALATIADELHHEPAMLSEAARELDEYFTGTRTSFSLPLDLPADPSFRATARARLRDIGYGDTRTYKEFATILGRPTAIRAAATACATNQLPIVVPCHRVVRGDGSLGGYLGGLPAKQFLLELEKKGARRG